MKVTLDIKETADWIKPPAEKAKNAARRKALGGDRDGPGSPPPGGRRLKKHYGPGPHPGTGTPQSVHGHRSSSARPTEVAYQNEDFEPAEVSASEFYPGFDKVRHSIYGGFLSPFDEEHFTQDTVRTFTAFGGMVGAALTDHGDGRIEIGSLYAVKGAPDGAGRDLLRYLIHEQGANWLNNFDGVLTRFYLEEGFQIEDRSPWNDEYAPNGWRDDVFGKPDYLEMRLREEVEKYDARGRGQGQEDLLGPDEGRDGGGGFQGEGEVPGSRMGMGEAARDDRPGDGREVAKHYGPGPHPNGSPQSVHAGGGKGKKADPLQGDLDAGGHHNFEVVGAITPEGRAADLATAKERLAEGKPLYRGVGVTLPDDLKAKVSALLEPAMDESEIDNRFEAGEMLLDYITSNGIGRHWTQDKRWAGIAADRSMGSTDRSDQWNIIVEIEPPDVSSVYPIQDRQGMAEHEVTLNPDGEYVYRSLAVSGGTWWDGENLLRGPITKHYGPGPHKNGSPQSVHAGGSRSVPSESARAEGSSITWTDRSPIPVIDVSLNPAGKMVFGTGKVWSFTVAETGEPVVAFRGMTSIAELREELDAEWSKWGSKGHVVHLEAEKGTSFTVHPNETFRTGAVGSWVTGEYEGELYAIQVAADLRGLKGVTLREPVGGLVDADRKRGVSITEAIPIDRIVAVRVIEGYQDYRDELFELGSRPSPPPFEQVRSSEYAEVQQLQGSKREEAYGKLVQRKDAWNEYFQEKGDYERAVKSISDRYRNAGYVEYRGPEAHQFIAMGTEEDRRLGVDVPGWGAYQAIETEAEFDPYGVLKHYGPGPHKNGSPQSVHAGGGKKPVQDVEPEDYRGRHQPHPNYGAPAHNLSAMVPDDIYTHPEWYFTMSEPYNREGARILQSIRGNPDASVKIYRAVPVDASDEINPGDWVTQVRSYADLHGGSNLGDYKVLSRTVKAKELVWPADSMVEFGWFPDGPFAHNPDYTLADLEDLRVEKRRKVKTSPGFPHGPSIKWPKVYEALRREGHDKSSAAAISNAHWNKYRRWGRAGNPGPKSAADYEAKRGRKARKRKGIPLPKSRRKSIVKHPWRGSQIHSTGTDQSVHGGHGRAAAEKAKMHPPAKGGYEHASAHADDLLDIDLTVNGKHYWVDGTEVPDTEDLMISGDLFNPEGDDVGDFTWTSDEDYPEWVKLDLVVIDPSERGTGLGLTVIREWENRLGEVGFTGMELQADAMGKYFWAVYGYGWELGTPPDNFLDHVKRSIENPSRLTATIKAMSKGSGDTWPDTFPQEQWDELATVYASPDPEPIDFASIGAGDGSGYHLGRAIMLTAEPWFGVKDIAA